MKLLLKPLQIIYCIYALLLFVALMFIAFPVVVIASFWGKLRGGNFIYKVCRAWTDAWFFLVGLFHRNIFEAPLDNKRQYIFVANHISYIDIPSILKAIRHQSIRALGKFEMKRVPVFGFIYQSAVVMVDRSSSENRANSVRILKSVLNRGISIFIFPEGTFNETEKPLKDFYDGAFKIAIDTQVPIKPILFLDTYDRLNYKNLFTLVPGKNRAVFLEETSTENLTYDDLPMLKEKIFLQMEGKLVEYGATWIGG